MAITFNELLPDLTDAVIIDIEADSLKPTRIWCVVCRELDTGRVVRFYPRKGITNDHVEFKEEFLAYRRTKRFFVGHNIVQYDAPAINKLLLDDPADKIKPSQVLDTLICSRLFRFDQCHPEMVAAFHLRGWDTRQGGHSLAAWGARLGVPKTDFHDFSQFSMDQLAYCVQDTAVNLGVFNVLVKEKKLYQISDQSIRIEQDVAHMLAVQEAYGCTLDVAQAESLLRETTELMDVYMVRLREAFPQRLVEWRTFTPAITKSGEMKKVHREWLLNNQHRQNPDGSYTLLQLEEPFNPKSGKQLAERLLALGWRPSKFTPTGAASTATPDIQTAIIQLKDKVPEVAVLEKYNIIFDRRNKAEKWLRLVAEAGDGRIHGKVWHIGCWTHRCSHTDDNMANVPSVELGKDKKPLYSISGNFGFECRNSWTVSDKEKLVMVGCDASGIQLRALSHYMGDPAYIKQLLEGDIHVVNQLAAGIHDRPTAKTFIYAWLLGAGDEKIGQIVGVKDEEIDDILTKNSTETKRCIEMLKRKGIKAYRLTVATILKGRRTKQKFLESLPYLKHFRTVVIPEAAAKGWMRGLDGRTFHIPNEHLAMAAYLQGFEAVIMKWAMRHYQQELRKLQIPFKQLLFVHDEFQIETPEEFGSIVGKTVVDSIKWAGVELGSLCPLDGEFRVGKSWAECH